MYKEKWALGVLAIVIISLLFDNTVTLVKATTDLLTNQQKDITSKNGNEQQLTIYYKKSGGFNRTDIRILYNSDIKEFVFVDLSHGIIKHQTPLSTNGEYNLTKIIIDNHFFQTKISDKSQCMNCLLYGLSVSLNNQTNTVYWTEETKNVNNLFTISKELEKLADLIYG